MKCAVRCCKNNRRYIRNKSFFRIPKDKQLCAEWLKAIGRSDYTPTSGSNVCEDHFSKSFTAGGLERKRLKIYDVPSHDFLNCTKCNLKETVENEFHEIEEEMSIIPEPSATVDESLCADANTTGYECNLPETNEELCESGDSSSTCSVNMDAFTEMNPSVKPITLKDCLESSDEEGGGTIRQIRQRKKLSQLREEIRRLQHKKRKTCQKSKELTDLLSYIKRENLITKEVSENLMDKVGLNWNQILKVEDDDSDDLQQQAVEGKPDDAKFKITVIDKKELIEQVKCFPVLYDPSCKDQVVSTIQNKIWETIGKKLNISPKQCMFVWMNIKSAYSKYLKRRPARKSTELQEAMHFLWPIYMKRFYNEVNDCTDNNKFILDIYDDVAEGFNYQLLDLISPHPEIYGTISLPQDMGSYQIEIWENIAEKLGQSIKYCYQTFLRLRKYYLEILIKKLEFSKEKPKVTTKFEIRMKFLWGTIEKLFPNAPPDFYADIDDTIRFPCSSKKAISDLNNSSELIIPDDYEEPTYLDCNIKKNNSDKESITADGNNVSDIQNQYSEELKRKLIKIVKEYPVLYDGIDDGQVTWEESTDQSVWEIIANEISSSDKECFYLWNSLNETFVQELKALMDDSFKELTWEFYEDMEFLLPYIKEKFLPSSQKKEKFKQEIMEVDSVENDYDHEDDIEESIIEESVRFENRKLLNCISKHKRLYDCTTLSKTDENAIWKSISKEIKLPANTCTTTWRKLRRKYLLANRKFSDQRTDEDRFYLNNMSFLKPFITNYEEDSEYEDIVDDIKFPSEEKRNEIAKIILKEVEKYPQIYLDPENREYAKKVWKIISSKAQISASACKLIFFEEVKNYKDVFLERFSYPHAQSYNLEDDIHFMKSYIESELKKTNIYMCKKFIKTVRKYPVLYSSDTSQCKNSTIWKKVAGDMECTPEYCIIQWRNIKNKFIKRIATKTFNKDWIFKDDLTFLKLSYIVDEWSIDNLPRISEDIVLNLLVSEIKKYPCLYDSNPKPANNKIIWERIGKHVKLSAEECKRFWGRLSSIYFEYMDRKLKIAPNGPLTKFGIDMLFLKPFHKKSIEFQKGNKDKNWIQTAETVFTPNELSILMTPPSKNLVKSIEHDRLTIKYNEENEKRRIRKRFTKLSDVIRFDCDIDSDEDDNINDPENSCREEIIILDCPHPPFAKTSEFIAKALVESIPKVGYDFFSITNLYSDAESENDDAGSSSKVNNVRHPKHSNLEQYYFSARKIVKRCKNE